MQVHSVRAAEFGGAENVPSHADASKHVVISDGKHVMVVNPPRRGRGRASVYATALEEAVRALGVCFETELRQVLTLRENHASQTARINELEAQQRKAEQELSAKDERIRVLEQQLGEKNQQAQSAQEHQRLVAERHQEELDQVKKAAGEELTRLQQEHEAELGQLKAQHTEQLEQKVGELATANEEYTSKHQQLADEHKELKEELDELEERNAQISAANKALQHAHDHYQALLNVIILSISAAAPLYGVSFYNASNRLIDEPVYSPDGDEVVFSKLVIDGETIALAYTPGNPPKLEASSQPETDDAEPRIRAIDIPLDGAGMPTLAGWTLVNFIARVVANEDNFVAKLQTQEPMLYRLLFGDDTDTTEEDATTE